MYINQHHHLYVSSGTGTWGPLMRLGSLNEISVMQIRPHWYCIQWTVSY